MKKKFKKLLLMDLDGVLNQYTGGFDPNFIPPVKEGAKEFLENLCADGDFEIVLFSTRTLLSSAKWLVANDLDKYFKDVTNVKIPCYLQIDDRAVCHKGNFEETLEAIRNFKVWWK